MSFRRSRYFFGEAFRGLVRNRLMSIASILTVASCILVVSVFYALASNIDLFLNRLESNIGMSVLVYNEVDAEGLRALHDGLLAIDNVVFVRYVSHEEAFDNFINRQGNFGILEDLPPDVLPRSFVVEIDDLRYHDVIAAQIDALMPLGIESVRQDRTIANTVITITNTVRWFSMGLIFVLAIISIVIITNTIRITVNARHAEINIMKYVGATDWFIRWPFFIEGVLIGLLGSLIAVGIVWAGYAQVVAMLQGGIEIIDFMAFREGHEIFIVLFPFVLFLGALIGSIGSIVSIRRHLHV